MDPAVIGIVSGAAFLAAALCCGGWPFPTAPRAPQPLTSVRVDLRRSASSPGALAAPKEHGD